MMGKKKGAKKEQPRQKTAFFSSIYEHHYKKLLIGSFILVLLTVASLIFQIATTGDFVEKGVSLEGGVVLTVLTETPVSPEALQLHLAEVAPQSDTTIRITSERGVQQSVIIEASDITSEELIAAVSSQIPAVNDKNSVSIDSTDPVLGELSFNQTLRAMFIAFLFMAIVVFLYFGEKLWVKLITVVLAIIAGALMLSSTAVASTIIALVIAVILIVIFFMYSIPSIAVILAAVSDILFALAGLNLFDIRLNIAGVAAFLMLIGYSVDTDILLSVRVLKRKQGSILDRVISAMKTGLTMNFATLSVVVVALIFTQSDVIRQIMIVLLFGLIGDMIYTWIQNAGVLRWYMEKRGNQR